MQFEDNKGHDQPAHVPFVQADLGLHCLLTKSMDTIVCIHEQRMSKSDCMDVHAHFTGHIWHKGLFPHIVHYITCELIGGLMKTAKAWSDCASAWSDQGICYP